MPGVSGALLAINFNIYEKLIDSVTNFFSNWKSNLKFLLIISSGIFLSIVLGSNIINYLITNYYFLTMMFFLGLIAGGTYNFAMNIELKKSDLLISIPLITIILLNFNSSNNIYQLKCNFIDNIVFFVGGFIEAFSSIIPGISGTAILMILGIYNNIIELIGNIFNINYVIENINLYLSFGLGLFISFIISTLLIKYFLKHHHRITNVVILSLCVSSIIILIKLTLNTKFILIELVLGIILLSFGLLISSILDK